jgi:hypothetical protein
MEEEMQLPGAKSPINGLIFNFPFSTPAGCRRLEFVHL